MDCSFQCQLKDPVRLHSLWFQAKSGLPKDVTYWTRAAAESRRCCRARLRLHGFYAACPNSTCKFNSASSQPWQQGKRFFLCSSLHFRRIPWSESCFSPNFSANVFAPCCHGSLSLNAFHLFLTCEASNTDWLGLLSHCIPSCSTFLDRLRARWAGKVTPTPTSRTFQRHIRYAGLFFLSLAI